MTVQGQVPDAGPRSLWRLFVPQRATLAVGLVWLVLTNLCALAIPRLVNEGIHQVEGEPVATSVLAFLPGEVGLVHVVLAIIVCALLGAVVRTLSRVVLFNAGRDIERHLRRDLFLHLTTLSLTYYGRATIGDLMSRLTNDLTNIRLLGGFALLNLLNAGIVFFATLPLLFVLDPWVAMFALLPFPMVLVAAQVVSKRMFLRTRENQEAVGQLSTAVQECLAGQPVVRAFSQEEATIARFGAKNERVYATAMQLAAVRLLMGPLMGLMGSLAIAIALYVGGRAVVDGRMSIGDIVEINTRLLQLTWPTIALGFVVSVWQRGQASLSRINAVFAARPDLWDGPIARPVQGALAARGLTVKVGAADTVALDGVDLEVRPGAVLGVVGRNGSGKSVLLKAIARQLPVPEGQLFLDGEDVHRWHLAALHQGIGVVPEDGFLFSASIRDNIAFGRPDATDAEVEAVVDLVDLRRDIGRFPEGIATLVGERGVTLSGGQRQRVALARAILTRPAVLLLDDSLSAVDAETEQAIIASLRAGFRVEGQVRRPTVVIVSHRLSGLRHADEIIGLAAGKVVERGSHEALLASGGLYAMLWGQQQRREALLERLGGTAGADTAAADTAAADTAASASASSTSSTSGRSSTSGGQP